ncbi:hypothetical protein D0T60_13025 [Bacteroides sp. 224]|nr:hypothetical protein [Bacteroides sp. 224]
MSWVNVFFIIYVLSITNIYSKNDLYKNGLIHFFDPKGQFKTARDKAKRHPGYKLQNVVNQRPKGTA